MKQQNDSNLLESYINKATEWTRISVKQMIRMKRVRTREERKEIKNESKRYFQKFQ